MIKFLSKFRISTVIFWCYLFPASLTVEQIFDKISNTQNRTIALSVFLLVFLIWNEIIIKVLKNKGAKDER